MKPSLKLTALGTVLAAMSGMSAVQAQDPPLPTEQLPLSKDLSITEGQTVTPAYEGWYEKPDGSIAVVYGYYNRNTKETLEVPAGENNRVEGGSGAEQPTQFEPGRHWGVFTVNVPDTDTDVTWHLETRGQSYSIPANLDTAYMIDAIVGDANGNYPPEIRFQESGPTGEGPAGITHGPVQATVGQPVELSVMASDDGIGAQMNEDGDPTPLNLAWIKQHGPGDVRFSESGATVPVSGGETMTQATFTEPGQYVVRVRVNDASGREGGGHAQCCWTNGFVEIEVNDQS